MNDRDLRAALRAGRRVYGTCVTSPSPLWPPRLKKSGADFVFIDTEHIAHDRFPLAWMCEAYRTAGLPPIVRVSAPDPYEACRVLDGGAAGVIVPYIEHVSEVRDLVGAGRWRPLKGRRLTQALEGTAALEPELREYLEIRNAATTLIVMIESVPALENLDALLSVPGIDAVLIGPHDLSCSLGIPEEYESARFNEAVLTIIHTARRHGLGVGIHFSNGLAPQIAWAQAGANFLVHSSDVNLFAEGLGRDLAALRQALGDATEGSASSDGGVIV